MKKGYLSLLTLIGLAVLYPAHFAHAYLDPGTGSYAIQALIGLVFGVAYTARSFGGRIMTGLKHTFGKKRADSDPMANTPDDGAKE